MNIVFYVILTLCAVYAVFHIRDIFYWWIDIMWIVPKAIWKLILKLFGKR